jgi:molybdopterin/thiamine biosynthesis adenylyltransferase
MKVRLRSRILYEIEHELWSNGQRFRQEEGGYLAGRFDGEALEIVSYWRDLDAARTPASIKLREAHLDFVTEQLAQGGDPSLYVIGTWHVHPPGYGAQPSPTDTEYLFLEHAAIRAGGLVDSRLPQAHLILGWGDIFNYRAYAMKVKTPGLQITQTDARAEHLHIINDALRQGCKAGILVRSGGARYEIYAGPMIIESLKASDLEGLFWYFPYRVIEPEVERIYLANFIHHVRQSARLLNRVDRKQPASFLYYRINQADGRLRVTPQRLEFSLNRPSEVIHAPCQVAEEATVLLSNPDAPQEPSLNLGAQAHTLIGDVGRVMQSLRGLETPPLLSTRRPLQEEKKWRQRTVMDEFGEVLLPDDVNIAELLDDRSAGAVRLYWRSPELRPDMVYELRTQRLQGLGYDRRSLAAGSALVAGLGLLGSEMVPLLVAAGLGRLSLVDDGAVDFTNIYRQRLYERNDVYQAKVDVAARRLAGSGITVEAHRLSIPAVSGNSAQFQEALEALDKLVAQSTLVIGTLDSFSARAVLQAICLHHRVHFLSVALDLLDPIGAQASMFLAAADQPGCYACGRSLVPVWDRGACTVAPLEFPPIVSGVAFRLVLDVLQGRSNASRAVQVYANLNVEQQEIGAADPQCAVCGPNGVVHGQKGNLFHRIQAWLQGEVGQPQEIASCETPAPLTATNAAIIDTQMREPTLTVKEVKT